MRNVPRLLIACIVTMIIVRPGNLAAEQRWADLKGRVLIDGQIPDTRPDDESFIVDPKTKGIANVIVYLPRRPAFVHPDFLLPEKASDKVSKADDDEDQPDQVKFEIKNNKFVPHILVVRTELEVRLTSHDPVTHGVQTYPIQNSGTMNILPPNKQTSTLPPFPKPEKIPAKVVSPFNGAMSAYWVILDHPYCAVTDRSGNFEIPNLPLGDHKFMVWHERYGYLKKHQQVKIKSGLNELAPMAFAAPVY